MDILTRADFNRLLATHAAPCVSVYLPTFPAGSAGQQGPIRLKNLLNEAEESLVARGQRAVESREQLREARALAADEAFWKDQSTGLALFVSPRALRHFRLPVAFDELAVAGDRFHLKPLLPLFDFNGRFFVLAASEKGVRLLQGTRFTIAPVDVAGLPKDMADALNYDTAGLMRQFHTAMAGGGRGGQHTDYHADGSHLDRAKQDLELYFREIDRALHKLLHDEESPLVFAGVDYLFPIFRKVTSYPHLCAGHVSGNPDLAGEKPLHAAAWQQVCDSFDHARQTALKQYSRLAGTGQTCDEVAAVVAAALEGEVETLLVDVRRHVWGRWEPSAKAVHFDVERGPRSDDLLDLAATQTWLHRGRVFAMSADEMPTGASLAAIFRYSRVTA